MEKVWQKNYQQGVPTEIDLNHYQSIIEMFNQSCKKFASRSAFCESGTEMSYNELEKQSRAFASFLQNTLKLHRKDRVAIMMLNLLQFPVVLFGVLRAGLIAVNVNPYYTPSELHFVLQDAGIETIIILSDIVNVLEQALQHRSLKHIIITEKDDMMWIPKKFKSNNGIKKSAMKFSSNDFIKTIRFEQTLKIGALQEFHPVKLESDDIAFLQYTGGTTGVIKAAVLTHQNIVANILQMTAWLNPALDMKNPPIIITALPLYHIMALSLNCFTFMMLGAKNILIVDPRNMDNFINEIKDSHLSVITGVNTLYKNLLHHSEITQIDFSHLSVSIAGGMPLERVVANKWYELTGHHIVNAYGLTEASGGVTFNRMDINTFVKEGIGFPLPSLDISIRKDGIETNIGESGELCLKGPQVMQGYWNNSVETAKVFTTDGWLRTGDIAIMNEEGYLRLIDRLKDIIIVSGFNVYSHEVEEIIAMHPDVLEVAIVGVPDKHSGEAVKAFIVSKSPHLEKNDLLSYCHQYLTEYKVPKYIEFCTVLPKTTVGKILKRVLRERKG